MGGRETHTGWGSGAGSSCGRPDGRDGGGGGGPVCPAAAGATGAVRWDSTADAAKTAMGSGGGGEGAGVDPAAVGVTRQEEQAAAGRSMGRGRVAVEEEKRGAEEQEWRGGMRGGELGFHVLSCGVRQGAVRLNRAVGKWRVNGLGRWWPNSV